MPLGRGELAMCRPTASESRAAPPRLTALPVHALTNFNLMERGRVFAKAARHSICTEWNNRSTSTVDVITIT
eukprot:6184786-Pleurochrysis_carterae.AAC.1